MFRCTCWLNAFVTATYPEEATTVGWEGRAYMDDCYSGHIDGFLYCYMHADGSDGATRTGRAYLEQYEDYKAGVGAGEASEAYRVGYVAGWEDALAAQREGVKPDTDEYYRRESFVETDPSHDFPSEQATLQYNNSTSGFMSLADGYTDVFFGTKSDVSQEEHARDRGVEFEYTPVGQEGFVFLVNASNPVDSLTIEQVKGIYSGKITNWKEVGGNDEPIQAYQRNSNSGSQSMMVRFMGDTPLMNFSLSDSFVITSRKVSRTQAA